MKLPTRVLSALIGLVSLMAAGPLAAAMPSLGTLSDTSGPQKYDSGPFMVANASSANGEPTCMAPAAPCDDYMLTVTLPSGYVAAHKGTIFTVSTAWTNPNEEFDLFLYDSTGMTLLQSAQSSTSPNQVSLAVVDGSSKFLVRISPTIAAGGATKTTIALVPPVAAGTGPVQKQPTGLPPRFKVDFSPAALANTSSEPSVGYNFKSRNGMYISSLQQLRLVFPWKQPDSVSTGVMLPESCDANWVDATDAAESKETLDPILHTESASGRTFISQLTGANSLFAFTDDDGLTYTQGQVGPPNGGPDHQTIGTGPYPKGSPFAGVAAAAGVNYATYYCSQGVVDGFCARSDDGGLTFGNGSPERLPSECGTVGALHGHVKVGPDGTVYVGPKDCSGLQAVFVSSDAATTFTTRTLPNTTADTEVDPSVAVGSDNTLYDCFISKDGHPHVQVSMDHGATWINEYDIGASVGAINATFPTATAGDGDRAACAFAGTNTAGNHDALNFTGIWYNYIAVTYDRGLSWATVNLTPNDPVQGAGGLCNGGTLCGSNRNLADFTEITTDEFGRVLFGYSDGCIGPCVQDPVGSNSFASKGAVGRQIGGRSLLSKFDNTGEPLKPAASCLAGVRTKAKSHLTWNSPDTGGAAVTGYNIFRSAALAGPYTQVGTSPARNTFDDSAAPATDPLYYQITAINSQGEGIASNIVKLPIVPDPVAESSCSLPGITVFTVKAGSNTGGSAGSPDTDLLRGAVAELSASSSKFTFILQFTQLSSPPRPGDYYIILTKDTAGKDIYLQADTSGNPGGMAFTYGTYVAGTAGVLTFTQVGTLDSTSSYDPKTGNIYLVAARSVLGSPAVGRAITLDVRVRQGSQSATSRDTGGPAAYVVNGADICNLQTPLAALTSDVSSGVAPLTVMFDASGSTTKNQGAAITSYVFDFGDSSPKVTQSTPTISHVYTTAGNYPARLTVTDSAKQTSVNDVTRAIVVTQASASVQFSFIERDNVPLNSFVTSETDTLTGFSGQLAVSVSSNANSQYSINGAPFTNASGMVSPNDKLTVRHVSASTVSTSTTTTVTVGTTSAPFKSVTTAVDRVPDAFSFGTVSGQDPSVAVQSADITLTGYTDPAPIVAGPGIQYSLDSGATYTSANGTLAVGQKIRVKETTNAAHLGYTKNYIKVGGVTGYFTTRTK